jgi:opacity protein-like surface antigen
MRKESSCNKNADRCAISIGAWEDENPGAGMRFTRVFRRFAGICVVLAVMIFFGADRARGQIVHNLEFSGGFGYSTGDNGLAGLTVGTSLWMSRRVSLGLDYDSLYDNSSIGTFDLTSIGHTAVKSHLQNFLVGPRVFFSAKRIKKYKFNPFAEVRIGDSLLSQTLRSVNVGSTSASAHSFSWLVGGGGDYAFNSHWSGRVNLDLLRTHIADNGQSRLRIGLGVAYTIAGRGPK